VMAELVALIPPGIDEIIALISMIDLLDDGTYARFVLDTAPTGHMLRLLEMPHLAMEWFRTLFRILLKYQGASAMAKTTELLLQTSRGVKKVQALLTDPARSTFVAVTIPEAMGVMETERFLAALDALHIPCHHLLVNLVVPETQCPFCRTRRREQQNYIEGLRAKFPTYIVSEAPLFPKDLRGVGDLHAMGRVLFA
jgi:arsenite/tail-anchored protein-transporting ATPase